MCQHPITFATCTLHKQGDQNENINMLSISLAAWAHTPMLTFLEPNRGSSSSVHASAWFSNQTTRDILWHELILARLKKILSLPSLQLFYLYYAVVMLPKMWVSITYADILTDQHCVPNSIHQGIHRSLLGYKAFYFGKQAIYGAKLYLGK